VKYFPGIIGGHCVMPNIEILRKFQDSNILRAIEASNRNKLEREALKELVEEKTKAVAVGSSD
jgi:hypothetical protein